MIVVDTTIIIDHLRDVPRARQAIAEAVGGGHRLVGSVLTRTEVLAGMLPGEEAATTSLLRLPRWEPVDVDVADRAGHFANRYRHSHSSIDTVDFVVAATAVGLGADVWTRNVRHFPMFAGLQPPY